MPDYAEFVFALLFCILNAFQGVFIFVSSILMKLFFKIHMKYFKSKNTKSEDFNKESIKLSSSSHKDSLESSAIYRHKQLSVVSSVETLISNSDLSSIDCDNVLKEDCESSS